jgi:hypothetical protein
MKSKRLNYNFGIDQIIESNLSVQTIQKDLKQIFGISNANLNTFKNPSFIRSYTNWDEGKKHQFIKTIGGVVYYGKIKKYLNDIIENNGAKI